MSTIPPKNSVKGKALRKVTRETLEQVLGKGKVTDAMVEQTLAEVWAEHELERRVS